ncbi:MAG: hypothetical protein ABIK77_06805 [candidate division WOR-3 bacterium]
MKANNLKILVLFFILISLVVRIKQLLRRKLPKRRLGYFPSKMLPANMVILIRRAELL